MDKRFIRIRLCNLDLKKAFKSLKNKEVIRASDFILMDWKNIKFNNIKEIEEGINTNETILRLKDEKYAIINYSEYLKRGG